VLEENSRWTVLPRRSCEDRIGAFLEEIGGDGNRDGVGRKSGAGEDIGGRKGKEEVIKRERGEREGRREGRAAMDGWMDGWGKGFYEGCETRYTNLLSSVEVQLQIVEILRTSKTTRIHNTFVAFSGGLKVAGMQIT